MAQQQQVNRTVFEGLGQFQHDERATNTASIRYDTGLSDKRLGERWELVAIGEEAAKFTFGSAVVPRPNRANMALVNRMLSGAGAAVPSSSSADAGSKAGSSSSSSAPGPSTRPMQAADVLPSVQLSDLMLLEKNITRLEGALRGVSYASSAILDMEQYLASYEDNQQAVRRSLDTIDVKTEMLHLQMKKQLGQALDPEGASIMCRRMEVLAALAPAINAAKANIDALEAIATEWAEVKKGAEMVVACVEEHEQTLDQVESDLVELENQLETTEKNVAQTFDIFERELLVTAKRYL